ncbi:hypothetical protein SLS62_008023 [Diatrype stigma]|uniref:NmrA-like domain-containing protein n=1 Tax=Diatrype stigma TaxID=117547 RepID=A0AAN9UNB2_9PEZI
MSNSNVSKKAILITGATGKQGGATIEALLQAGALEIHEILAVTRNPGSGSAKKLEARGITLVQGNLNDIPGIFSNAKAVLGAADAKVWGVFSVQLTPEYQAAIGKGASVQLEEVQGKALVDAALANGVKSFVYASVDRGGEQKSYDNPTGVPHFISKHNIEHHLIDSAAKARGAMQWTILRPVAFMENFTPGFGTKLMATTWRVAVRDKPLQLVSVRDIGWFAAQAFLRPDDFAGRSISLAGDELTLAQANAAFQTKIGREMPETFQFVARLILWLSAEFGGMFRWFYTDGFGADLKALRAEHPGLLSWSEWLDTASDWTKKTN